MTNSDLQNITIITTDRISLKTVVNSGAPER